MDLSHSEFYFKTADTDLELERCYRLRYQVYCKEKRWLCTTDCPEGKESDAFDLKAIHVMALNEDFELVGMMRILRKEDFSILPYEDHPGIKDKRISLTDVAELSRFIVTSEKYRYHVTHGLLRAVYQTSKGIGLRNWVFILEPSLFRLLGMFKFYLKPLGTPSMYFGAFTMVAGCNIPYTERMWKTRDKEAWAFNSKEALIMSTD
jgi:N-acyl-L-homoserine lactone synthetase